MIMKFFKSSRLIHLAVNNIILFQGDAKVQKHHFEELITIKVIFIQRQGMFRYGKISKKSVEFLTHIIAFQAAS